MRRQGDSRTWHRDKPGETPRTTQTHAPEDREPAGARPPDTRDTGRKQFVKSRVSVDLGATPPVILSFTREWREPVTCGQRDRLPEVCAGPRCSSYSDQAPRHTLRHQTAGTLPIIRKTPNTSHMPEPTSCTGSADPSKRKSNQAAEF